jgi:hypothetical protein
VTDAAQSIAGKKIKTALEQEDESSSPPCSIPRCAGAARGRRPRPATAASKSSRAIDGCASGVGVAVEGDDLLRGRCGARSRPEPAAGRTLGGAAAVVYQVFRIAAGLVLDIRASRSARRRLLYLPSQKPAGAARCQRAPTLPCEGHARYKNCPAPETMRKSGAGSMFSVIGSDKLDDVVDDKKETKWRLT